MIDVERVLDRAIRVALAAADAEAATRRTLADRTLAPPVRVLAVGKAALGMARAAQATLGPVPTLVVAPDGPDAHGLAPGTTVLRAAHPLPDARSVAAAEAALAFVAEPCATLLVLLSGGGSALLEKPLPSLTLEDLRRVSDRLSRQGAPIARWNAVRGALSAVKHGRLLATTGAREVLNVVISDVPGAPPSVVSSGPTSPPATSVDWDEIERLVGRPVARPAPISLAAPTTLVAASAETVRDAVARALVDEGLVPRVHVVPQAIEGEARDAAQFLVRALEASGAPALVAAGEVTVEVRGEGVGGPASELMLAVLARSSLSGVALGTDGIDGASRFAGAKVTPAVRARAAARGLDAEAALARNDAATFFERADGAIVTGPTGTNTAELYLLLAG